MGPEAEPCDGGADHDQPLQVSLLLPAGRGRHLVLRDHQHGGQDDLQQELRPPAWQPPIQVRLRGGPALRDGGDVRHRQPWARSLDWDGGHWQLCPRSLDWDGGHRHLCPRPLFSTKWTISSFYITLHCSVGIIQLFCCESFIKYWNKNSIESEHE